MSRPLVLVADDEPLLLTLLERKLTAAGYRVKTAHDGGRVLELVALERPAALVLDGMMPVMDGFEVLRRLKADPELAGTVVIMLTALKREHDIVTALKLGAADYLVKPFIPDELVLRLSRLVPVADVA